MPEPHPSIVPAQDLSLTLVRELVRTYQAFSSYSEVFVRQYRLTPAQFDVIATLGNTPGLTMGEIGETTLITKGTLTGVIDRLEQKGFVVRESLPEDRRRVIVKLTSEGTAVFQEVFPAHLADIQSHCESLNPSELELLCVLLKRFRQVF